MMLLSDELIEFPNKIAGIFAATSEESQIFSQGKERYWTRKGTVNVVCDEEP